MNHQQFQTQMSRLSSQFPASYSTERVKIIWNEVKDLEVLWFESVVDEFIGSSRQAPLLPEFRQEASKERERVFRNQRRLDEYETNQFLSGEIFKDDDRKFVLQTIVARMQGKVSDAHWTQFVGGLDETIKNFDHKVLSVCNECDSTGVVIDETNTVYRCTCKIGMADKRPYPIFKQTIGKRA